MAVVAIRISLLTVREARALRATRKREAYFTRYIIERCVSKVDAFVQTSVTAVTDCIAELDHCDEDAAYDIYAATGVAAEKYQTALLSLKGELFFATETWPDADLWVELRSRVYELEDLGLNGIDRLVARSEREAGLEDAIRSRAGGLLKYLLAYDETKHEITPPSAKRKWYSLKR
jgi:hypothetical protein